MVAENFWDDGFAALQSFKAREGHCSVPQLHIEGTFQLGMWVHNQRRLQAKLSAKRKQQLDAIGFVWKRIESQWEEGFATLVKFKTREGHCLVPQRHIEGKFRLGKWVVTQRRGKHSMLAKRRQRLDVIGFVWRLQKSDWEDAFALLQMFKAREGHCRVPINHFEEMFWLGRWVNEQRRENEAMPGDRWQRLDEIGFVWRVK